MQYNAKKRKKTQKDTSMGNADKIADLPQERRNLILRELKSQGKLVAAELSERYGVSEDTIRRDLREMAQAGLLKRVHGGALPVAASKGTLLRTR